MSERKKIYFYIATNLAMLIPVPGRFAYAIILILLFNLQMAVSTMIFHAIHRMNLSNMRNALLSLTIIALGILYKQLLIIFCPIAALTLSYCIFLPTLASVIIEFFFLNYEQGVKAHIAATMKKSCVMSLFLLFFFFIRDILGYATITFPGWKKIVVIQLPYNPSGTGAGVFLATIPGSLCFMALLLALYIFVAKKINIFLNSPVKQEVK
ncbi:hypothetical protein DYE50_06880 [Treponema ruminis]|uniref:Uncharacterized protein n=1 Tax=Treponema ruminis TaxID=744515 RepID=A0A7W8LLL6_9SPIR|nr:hypothetical protein [Treponema ruminis]MBB5225602.1 hypothetical protein [Treponema ruminis]QSI02290.1 hypothetical protein DYE50_06880 [Treponema ruminis]